MKSQSNSSSHHPSVFEGDTGGVGLLMALPGLPTPTGGAGGGSRVSVAGAKGLWPAHVLAVHTTHGESYRGLRLRGTGSFPHLAIPVAIKKGTLAKEKFTKVLSEIFVCTLLNSIRRGNQCRLLLIMHFYYFRFATHRVSAEKTSWI